MTAFVQNDPQLSATATAVIVPRGSGVTAEDLAAVHAAIRSVDAHMSIRFAPPSPTGRPSSAVAEDQIVTFSVLEAAALQTALEVTVTGAAPAAVSAMKHAIGNLLREAQSNAESSIKVTFKYMGPSGRSVVFSIQKAKRVKVNSRPRRANAKRPAA